MERHLHKSYLHFMEKREGKVPYQIPGTDITAWVDRKNALRKAYLSPSQPTSPPISKDIQQERAEAIAERRRMRDLERQEAKLRDESPTSIRPSGSMGYRDQDVQNMTNDEFLQTLDDMFNLNQVASVDINPKQDQQSPQTGGQTLAEKNNTVYGQSLPTPEQAAGKDGGLVDVTLDRHGYNRALDDVMQDLGKMRFSSEEKRVAFKRYLETKKK